MNSAAVDTSRITKSHVALYLLVLALGFYLGRQLPAILEKHAPQDTTASTAAQGATNNQVAARKTVDQTLANRRALKNSPERVNSPERINSPERRKSPEPSLSPAPNELALADLHLKSPIAAINYLAALDQTAFYNSFLYQQMRTQFTRNPDLAYGMLEMLLDIADPQTKTRVSQVLANYRTDSTIHPRYREYPAVDWIVERISNGDRTNEWISVLARWGAKTPESVEVLLTQISTTTQVADQQTILTALSRANSAKYSMVSKYTAEQRTAIANKLQPYFDSTDEHLRASALTTLGAFTNALSKNNLLQGLQDSSEAVRLSAIDIISNTNLVDASVKSAIIDKLNNQSLRAIERVSAHRVIQNFTLNDVEYQQLYNFEKNALPQLQSAAHNQQQSLPPRKPQYYGF